jgi:hypothetical protein
MKHKLGICIPYRNREFHLSKLIPSLSKHLNDNGIDHKFYVGHQVDDRLFNRGGMKNIAAEYAFNDGCDYIAWHDVDMLPHPNCDYSYPEDFPTHISTNLEKYNYGIGYDQYFGGIVLFTKEQVEKTNGYSNEYWDWGQEDDDLFWRCYYEGYTTGKIFKTYENKKVGNFNGKNSLVTIPTNREISSCLHNDHTISILFNAEQQPEKVPIYLVGDENKRYIEYPILRKQNSWTWGLSFNNSRALSMLVFDKNNEVYYNWGKRFENMWTWLTLSYSKDEQNFYFYINDDLVCQMNGIKESKPYPTRDTLKLHNSTDPFNLGFCKQMNTFFKGKIAEVKIYNTFFNNINDVFETNEDPVLHYDFTCTDGSENIDITDEKIEVIENILPYRRYGHVYCLHHDDEGFINGKWAKGETTARNERRFVTEMQQRKIDYKNDGMNNITKVTEVVSIDDITYPNTMIINTKMLN